MAADVIFTEGSEAAANAARQIETARLAEHQAADLPKRRCGRSRRSPLAPPQFRGPASSSLLIPRPRVERRGAGDDRLVYLSGDERLRARPRGSPRPQCPRSAQERPLPLHEQPAPETTVATRQAIALKAAAALATDFGRVRDRRRADPAPRPRRDTDGRQRGGHLARHDHGRPSSRPVLAHGYGAAGDRRACRECRAPPTTPRPPPTARDSCRSCCPGPAAPLARWSLRSLPPTAASARCRPKSSGGGEASESVQALAAIFAAHLATVLANSRPRGRIGPPTVRHRRTQGRRRKLQR